MTIFVDASALVAIIRDEPESAVLQATLAGQSDRLTSGIAMWEAMRALNKVYVNGSEKGLAEVRRYCAAYGVTVVSIGADEAVEAFRAQKQYGKGTGHPAKLNMGDCFAYACAKINGAKLLYKGGDFSHTDLA